MIVFVCTAEHQYTIRDVLETRPNRFDGRICILAYDEFLAFGRLPLGEYVFTDLDRLEEEYLACVRARFQKFRESVGELVHLNSPLRPMDRLTVMRTLETAGINDFRVFPIDEMPADVRFPVFLRFGSDHRGPRSALLHSREDVEAARAALAGACAPEDLLVTEFIDVRNAAGLFEKLSYVRVGETLYPFSRDVSTNWVCKGLPNEPDLVDESEIEVHFLRSNDHADQIREIFDLVGIEYGRIDFAFHAGRLQVFEINTNPMMERIEHLPEAWRPNAQLVFERWCAGLEAFARAGETRAGERRSGDGRGARWVPVPGSFAIPKMRSGGRRRGLVRACLRAFGGLHWETWAMRGLRQIGLA